MELINTVLTPRWTYRLLLISSDFKYKQLDKLSQDFVTQCKGLEKGRHSTKMTTPVTEQGMGLYQQFWAIKKRYVAVLLLVHHPAVGGNDRDLLSATTPASPQQHLPVR